jgi:MSHA biogenesis protein MshI
VLGLPRLSFLRAPKGAGWISLQPNSDRVLAVHLVQGEGMAKLQWAWSADCARATELPVLLQNLRKAQPCNASVVWLLGRGQYQLLSSEAPEDLPRQEWRDALRWQLKEMAEFDVASAQIDVLDVPGNPQLELRRQQVWAVLSPRKLLEPLVVEALAAHMRLAAIDIPETALRNLSGRCEPEGRAQALLSFGSGTGQLVVTYQGELMMARQIDVQAQALSSDDDARRDAAIDRSSLEVQRTLDSFERVHSHLLLSRLLVVPGPGLGALSSHLAQFISVPVQTFDLSEVVDTSAAPELAGTASGPWLNVIGAALREA